MNAQLIETLKNNLPIELFKTSAQSSNELAITTDVVGLSLFQMPMIYHHISSGMELNFHYNYGASNAQQAVEVYFKNYKLGHLSSATAETIEKILMHGFDVKVRVVSISKQKYLPISALTILITDNIL